MIRAISDGIMRFHGQTGRPCDRRSQARHRAVAHPRLHVDAGPRLVSLREDVCEREPRRGRGVADAPNVARLVGLVLTRSGHQSEVVADGNMALQRIREVRPDIVFADLAIKGLSGQALCSTLKSEEATRSIPYIILSGDRDLAE